MSLSIATKNHMDGTTEGMKPRRPRRRSVEGKEAEGADPPKVKQEDTSAAGKQEVPKRRAEEGDPTERKRKAAVAALRKKQLSPRRTALPRRANRVIPIQKVIRPQKVMLLAAPLPKEKEAL